MTEARDVRIFEGDDVPRIWVDIRLVRRIRSLPPMAVRAWQALKNLLFVACLASGVALLTVEGLDAPQGLRLLIGVGMVWLVWDQVIARRRPGVSHILLTTKGVLLTDENVYVRWEEIEGWQLGSNLLRFKPKPGFGATGLFAPTWLEIPLAPQNKDIVLEHFREHAKVWKPE